MTASTFNPLAAARALEAAGVDRRQAEAHAEALREAATADRNELATKADLAGLEARMSRALWIQRRSHRRDPHRPSVPPGLSHARHRRLTP